MNAQESWWAGEAGNAYTARNRVDWRARIPFWRRVIDETGARSVYEVGCNAGWNLSAIRRVYPDVEVSGHDVNQEAGIQARNAGLHSVSHAPYEVCGFDLVFTAGMLIHVSPEHLAKQMQWIVDASAQYVLAIEYGSEVEEPVYYRGHEDRLWKRPYGFLYQSMGLRLVWERKAVGFDNCNAWLLEKV